MIFEFVVSNLALVPIFVENRAFFVVLCKVRARHISTIYLAATYQNQFSDNTVRNSGRNDSKIR